MQNQFHSQTQAEEYSQTTQLSDQEIQDGMAEFSTRVYTWMSGALLLTAFTAYVVSDVPAIMNLVYGNSFVLIGIFIAQIIGVVYLSARIEKLDVSVAASIFVGYALLTGLTLGGLFHVYTSGSLATAFFATSGAFGGLSLFGYFTKKDLTGVGKIAYMGLFGIIIASVINIFMQSDMMYWLISYLGVAIFAGLIAYKAQMLKAMYMSSTHDEELQTKLGILGALSLYLSFINLFLFILRIVGRRR